MLTLRNMGGARGGRGGNCPLCSCLCPLPQLLLGEMLVLVKCPLVDNPLIAISLVPCAQAHCPHVAPKTSFVGGLPPMLLPLPPFPVTPRRDVGFGKVPSGIHFIHSQPFPLPLPPVPRPLPPCCPKKLQISGAAHATISHSSLMLLRVVLGITVL